MRVGYSPPAAVARASQEASLSVAGTRLGPTWSRPRSSPSANAPHRGLGPSEVRAPSWRMRLAMKTSLTGLRSSADRARASSWRSRGRTWKRDGRAACRARSSPPVQDRSTSAPDDFWRAGRTPGHPVLLGQQLGLVHQGVDDLGLGHGADDLAVAEDLALALARGHAHVGLAGLPGAVDDAAHDRDPHRGLDLGHALLDGVGQGEHVDLGPPAGRAGNQV